MSGAIWFIADLHFGHEKVSTLRGFSDTVHHDFAITKKWERQVQDDDMVYVLGDISGGSRVGESHALSILAELPGRKRLIAGNHDSVASIHRKLSPHTELFGQVFERVSDFGRIRLAGRDILLSHYPYDADHEFKARYIQYRLPNLGMPLIHGHTHSETRFNVREACVSWEAWGRLVNLGDLVEWFTAIPEVTP
jgi:calcineurin-like phosphoesterase family protein